MIKPEKETIYVQGIDRDFYFYFFWGGGEFLEFNFANFQKKSQSQQNQVRCCTVAYLDLRSKIALFLLRLKSEIIRKLSS